jgi:hypothetical protein
MAQDTSIAVLNRDSAATNAAAIIHLRPRGHSNAALPLAAGMRDFPMIDLYDLSTNQLIGAITEADLQVLVDALEEESLDDHDYYIDAATIDVVADGRATEHLVKVLRAALGTKEGVDIRWQRR